MMADSKVVGLVGWKGVPRAEQMVEKWVDEKDTSKVDLTVEHLAIVMAAAWDAMMVEC